MTATDRPCPAALIVNGDHYPCDWPTAIAAEVEEVIAARVAAVVAAVEAVANTIWRETPCGCGHRADLHGWDVGCIGGLALCPCNSTFSAIVAERIQTAIAPFRPAIPTAAQITADTVTECKAIADEGHERAKAAGQ